MGPIPGEPRGAPGAAGGTLLRRVGRLRDAGDGRYGETGCTHSTDDIACWFIDTNYNGDSFFVRHAYFTGADDPYQRLKMALRSEIDADAWVTLNSTVSLPFAKPSTGKIAVKVINHYGDDVLKVYDLG